MTPRARRTDFEEAVRRLHLSLGLEPGVFIGAITVHCSKGKDPKPDVRHLVEFVDDDETVATVRKEA
jgi:hypothetical protein